VLKGAIDTPTAEKYSKKNAKFRSLPTSKSHSVSRGLLETSLQQIPFRTPRNGASAQDIKYSRHFALADNGARNLFFPIEK
ncbi:unnamed protein product, partial [Acidithrix sp. C25]